MLKNALRGFILISLPLLIYLLLLGTLLLKVLASTYLYYHYSFQVYYLSLLSIRYLLYL